MGAGPSTQRQTQQAVVPIPAITEYVPTPGSRFEHIPQPTYDESIQAAVVWNRLANRYNIAYAFVGSFAARLGHQDVNVLTIEIVVDPAVYASDGIARIMQENPELIAITDTSKHIVLIGHNRGVSFICYALGTNGYPDRFISPYEVRLPGQPEHTYYHWTPPFDPHNPFPVMHSRMLLQQRLARFDIGARDETQNIRDFADIKAFLRCTKKHNCEKFPTDVANELFPRLLGWLKYAQARLVSTKREDLMEWKRLGFDVPDEFISRRYRIYN
jgi:hypothetical protein